MNCRTLRRVGFQIGVLLLCALVKGEGLEEMGTHKTVTQGYTLKDSEIKTMLRDNIELDKEAVGLVVGIVDDHGKRVISHGKFGNGSEEEVDGDTLFEIGSVTKVFTALLLQEMIERGEMNLDDPVRRYLPDSVHVPTYQGKEITLLHLATHTSGLPRDSSGDLYTFLNHCTLGRAPGKKQEYSNLGMGLLGHCICLRAGKDYETLILERICRPLGMDNTKITLSPALKARLASGHAMPSHRVRDFSAEQRNYDFRAPSLLGAGSLHSTANDLLKFLSAYAGLSSSPLAALMEKAKGAHLLESGAKLRLAWSGDGTLFEHGGLTDGYETELLFDTNKRRGIVILSNCANYSTVLPALWPSLLEGHSPKPDALAAVDPSVYDGYTGQYAYKRGMIWTIRRDGDRLLLQWIGKDGERSHAPSVELFPISETVFRNEFYGDQVTFLRNAQGQNLKMIFAYPQGTLNLARVSTSVPRPLTPVQLDGKAYDSYVGQYRWTTLFKLIRIGPTLNVSHRTDEVGEHLFVSVQGYGIEEVFPTSKSNFIPGPTAADNLRLKFVQNGKGNTKGVMVDWNGSRHRGTRISLEPGK
jgi:D-alanyl-D-alanine-carboxypeptidase/D-alanyl-D-alanine-endopeptidase